MDSAATTSLPRPTLADVSYGSHDRQVMDFWQAKSSLPTPALLYIHGGAWIGGDKSGIDLPGGVQALLDAGISVVSTNYRYLKQTIIQDDADRPPPPSAADVATGEPPVAIPLSDAARALQYVRSRAAEWNIDKERIAVAGGSAGACSSLWLAFHDDLADPQSDDPISRESTKPYCAAVDGAQTTLDPQQMIEWTPNSQYGGHAFGFAWNENRHLAEFEELLANRETVLPWIEKYSPYTLASAGAPPVYLYYAGEAPAYGKPMEDPTHASNFGALLKQKLDTLGCQCELYYPGAADVAHANIHEYLVDVLTTKECA